MVKSFSNAVVAQYAQRSDRSSPCRYQNLRMLKSLKGFGPMKTVGPLNWPLWNPQIWRADCYELLFWTTMSGNREKWLAPVGGAGGTRLPKKQIHSPSWLETAILGYATINVGMWVHTHSCLSLLRLHGPQPAGLLLSVEFSRQENWSGFPFPLPGDLPDWGIETASPALPGVFFTAETAGKQRRGTLV